uniref:Uncharacterized protein n=1 Tax=viral metagenome TaxID=1070528 RepID=A0A6M3L7A5_9ZZZZ
MPGMTNTGKSFMLNYFQGVAAPVFAVALCTGDTVATAGTLTLANLTQVPQENGYTAGAVQLTPGTTDFDVRTQDGASSKAYVQVKDITWTASGGSIPSSGNGALYAVLTEATTAVTTNRAVFAYFSLSTGRSVSSGQTLTVQDMTINALDS